MKRENKLKNIFYIEDNIIRSGEEKKMNYLTFKEREKRNQGGVGVRI